jgi:hypothetical protein
MLDPHRVEIEGWLDAEPMITAVDVLTRLKARYPDSFTENHLRTAQRMVKAWRADQAKHIIHQGTAALQAAMGTVTPPPSL